MSLDKNIIATLRQRGYRITPQREMVIDTIAHSETHLSAEEIFAEIEKRTKASNLATVYRTLDLLWREGFARRNDLSEGKTVYVAHSHGPHIHLICRRCDEVIEADLDALAALKDELSSKYDFDADLEHLSIFGCCANCTDPSVN